MAAPASIRALLARSIDYAGMFPPCSLDLATALANQARYVRDADAWMLSAFVLPIVKFGAASGIVSRFNREQPLRISALGPKTNSASEFISALKTAAETVRSFSNQHVDLVSVEQIEMVRAGRAEEVDMAKTKAIIGDLKLRVFWETSTDAAAETIASLAGSGFGYKLRTGGVTADAFPASTQIAKALVAAAQHRVSIKFTAGLHHPVRQFRDEVKTKMHGFLNVLGAGVLTFEHKWDETQVTAMLEDEHAKSFTFDDSGFAWREWKIDNQRIEAHRKFVTSFGSCSFDEPREDLRGLNLL